ncbi:MAG: GntR family transcriptional regulator YhfZ [Bacillota bacterium]
MTMKLLTKQGEIVAKLARQLLTVSPGYRLPSVSDYCNMFSAGAGTVHAALRTLTNSGAIELEIHGHQGTVITGLNRMILWKFSLNTLFYGSMPLPYTSRLQGMATAIYEQFEEAGIPFSLAYVRGGRMRIQRLLDKHTDFAVCSRLTARLARKEYPELFTVMDFGHESYLTHSMLVFSKPGITAIEDGMRVGVDESSYDHPELVKVASRGKNVTFVPQSYNQIISKIRKGEIDATVWSLDEIEEKYPGLNMVPAENSEEMKSITYESACAVILIREDTKFCASILREVLDLEKLSRIQKEVMDGHKTPSY